MFGLSVLSECLFKPIIGLSVNSDRFSSANHRSIRRLSRLDLVYYQMVLLAGTDDIFWHEAGKCYRSLVPNFCQQLLIIAVVWNVVPLGLANGIALW